MKHDPSHVKESKDMIKQKSSKSKSAQRTVKIVNGFRKPSGTIIARIQNDQGVYYRTCLFADGTTDCRQCKGTDPKQWEECKGHAFTGHCYHVTAAREVAHVFGPEGLLVDEVAAQNDRSYERATGEKIGNAYEQEAAAKQTALDAERLQYTYYLMGIGAPCE